MMCVIFWLLACRNSLVNGLRLLDAAKGGLGELQVPFEVVQYVDEAHNPQGYTKDCMERAIQKNEEVKGRIDALKVSQSGMQGNKASV